MRKFIATSALTVLAIGTLIVPAGAAAPVNATGSLSCSGVTGSSKFAPALVSGSTRPGHMSSKGSYSNCKGVAAIATGSGTGNDHLATNDCLQFADAPPVLASLDLTEVVRWKGSTKVNASTIHWTQLGTRLDLTTIQAYLFGVVVSGSFQGESATKVQIAAAGQDTAFFAAACGSAKGLKGYTTVSGSLSIG